jgi:hypothetical protein
MVYYQLIFNFLSHHSDLKEELIKLKQDIDGLPLNDGDEVILYATVEKLSGFDKNNCHTALEMIEEYMRSIGCKYNYIFHPTGKSLIEKKQDNFHFFDTWAMATYRHCKNHYNKFWNPDTKKALFLVGKPFKIQRIGLLNNFYKNNLMDYLHYSLYCPPRRENVDKIKDLNLSDLTEDYQINKLLIDINKPSLDVNYEECHTTNVFEYRGFPTNLTYFKNTSLSIVSETYLTYTNDATIMPYVTEKFYRAVANNHPFITLGDSFYDEHLESIGYKTFNEFFLPKPKFRNDIRYVQWVTNSVKHFLDNAVKNKLAIEQIVNHNHKIFTKQVEAEIAHFNKHNIDILKFANHLRL